MPKDIIKIESSDGQKLQIAGGSYRIIISGKETNGTYAIIEMTVPAGAGPVPHAHPDFEEIFYVLDGELTFRSAYGTCLAQKGATVTIPKGGIIHNFKNHSDQTARILCTVIPAGLEDFFIEVSDYIHSDKHSGHDQKETIQILSEKYGQTLYNPDYWEMLSS